jgi:hypothetical protein
LSETSTLQLMPATSCPPTCMPFMLTRTTVGACSKTSLRPTLVPCLANASSPSLSVSASHVASSRALRKSFRNAQSFKGCGEDNGAPQNAAKLRSIIESLMNAP